MTRRSACVLAAALVLGLHACGGSEEDAGAPAASDPATTATPAATEGSDRGYGY